jgi:hypothetical protein
MRLKFISTCLTFFFKQNINGKQNAAEEPVTPHGDTPQVFFYNAISFSIHLVLAN